MNPSTAILVFTNVHEHVTDDVTVRIGRPLLIGNDYEHKE
jgi:hypothetical protein